MDDEIDIGTKNKMPKVAKVSVRYYCIYCLNDVLAVGCSTVVATLSSANCI